jgi:hypothetical protein
MREWAKFGYGHEASQDMIKAAAEIEQLRAALEEIISFQVFGFAITAPEGGDVWCEGTNRFIREEAMVKVRKIARAALGGENDCRLQD